MLNNENIPNEQDLAQGQDDQNKNPKGEPRKDQPLDKNLVEKIRKENELLTDISGSVTTREGFDQEAIEEPELQITHEEESTHSLTKNQLGDNPPGSEEKAFEEGYIGDMGKNQAKYEDKNLIEHFRENLDKTEAEINLDKKLKGHKKKGNK